MKHDERNASAFVIVGCVMLFFIVYQAVSILACRYLDQKEARYQMNHSYQMSIEDEEGSADHYGRIYDQFMKQAVEKLHGTFTVVGFLMPNDSMTDPVETDIVVGEKTGTGACMIGAGLQEKLKAFGEKTDSIQLGTQEFPVEGIHSNRSAFAIDNKAYLYWDEMTQQQREYIYEEMKGFYLGGSVLRFRIDNGSAQFEQWMRKSSVQNRYGIVKCEKSSYFTKTEAAHYMLVGTYLMPILVFFGCFNSILTIRFWCNSRKKELYIRRIYGYDLRMIWNYVMKKLIRYMGLGLILGCLLQLVYSVLFTPVLALGQTAVLQLGLFFGCVALFLILIAVITLVWIIYFMGRGAYETI